MSYQIYYDRAFIRVGTQFIPLVNSGSNNCFEFNYRSREVCEKNWSVLNWKRRDRLVFSRQEIVMIAREYDQLNQENGMSFKSRNQCFAHGEMERWIINGMKRAYTVEEYVSFWNSLYILDYSPSETNDWKEYPLKTTEDLLRLLEELKDAKQLCLKLGDNRRVHRPASSRAPRKKLNTAGLAEYYVLKGEYEGANIYFLRFNRSGGFKYYYHPHSSIKAFKSEKEAQKYLEKYHDRLVKHYQFKPEKISKAA